MVRIAPGGAGGTGGGDSGSSGSSSGGGFDERTSRDEQTGTSGGSSPPTTRESTTVEEETGALDRLSQRYTETVAEPVGDITANASPVVGLEQAAFGTTRTRRLSEGAGEGAAQLGNVPGALAGVRDGAKAAATAYSRGYDQVTVGGVPTGVVVPDQEGQQQNARAATDAAASAAGSAAANPFRTTGQLIGGALAGAAGSRAISNVARRTSTGSGSAGSSGSLGSSPTQALDDFFGDTRATTTGRARPDSDTDTSTFDGSGVQSGTDFEADLKQQDLTQRQDILRDQASREQSVQRGLVDEPDGADPIGSGGNGPTFNPDRPDVAGPSRQTTTPGQAVPPEFSGLSRQGNLPTRDLRSTLDTQTAGGSTTGTATGTGAGLGAISSTTDPTGISDTDSVETGRTAGGALTASDLTDQLAGQTAGGALGGVGTTPTFDERQGRNNQTGPTGLTDTMTDTTTDTPTDTGTNTDTGTVTDVATRVGTQTGAVSGFSQPQGTQVTVSEAAESSIADPGAAGLGSGGGGSTGTTRGRPRPGTPDAAPDDDAATVLFGTDDEEFRSGILGGGAAAADVFGTRE